MDLDLHPHLFRHESGRMIAALTRIFGVHNLALAEDVVQDTFGRALEAWKERGVPENPSAWLMLTAKRRALDILRRDRKMKQFAPELGRLLETEWAVAPLIDEAFAPRTIRDEQLRMMFSCCHPQLSEEAQLALILNILCGFSAAEIASAFLSTRDAIEKRIARGKKTLADAQRLFDLSDEQLGARVATVRHALYLLFNEGYHGASPESAVRVELCQEAIRLALSLCEHPASSNPTSYALASLMCLHGARLPARIDDAGDLNALMDQDRSRWDAQLIERGLALLERSAAGDEITGYHLEAAIAAAHLAAPSLADTDWRAIVDLYDRRLAIAPSPVIALNRAIALSQL
ncbi:MAG TPA: DUF6596 domain-containing protein, partial [Polyangiales bacterium]|nr:DUF6596 domain-containing protein [Polyangiales bacterium]